MKVKNIIGALGTISLAACAPETETQSDTAETLPTTLASASISDAAGANVGLASIIETGNALSLKVTLSGMPPGEKALHFHTTGACDAPDFKSAGGHLNPAEVSHGKLSDDGPHLGDFPNITIAEDGLAEISLPVAGTAQGAAKHILDADSTAIMIHAGPDDYKSDPAGAAGPRIACGVFEAS
ncbi:MAG: superoxide dismutase family protein [Erythrobacter sp.]